MRHHPLGPSPSLGSVSCTSGSSSWVKLAGSPMALVLASAGHAPAPVCHAPPLCSMKPPQPEDLHRLLLLLLLRAHYTTPHHKELRQRNWIILLGCCVVHLP